MRLPTWSQASSRISLTTSDLALKSLGRSSSPMVARRCGPCGASLAECSGGKRPLGVDVGDDGVNRDATASRTDREALTVVSFVEKRARSDPVSGRLSKPSYIGSGIRMVMQNG